MATRRDQDHERAAAGMDYEDPIRERAASIGAAMAEGGPQALFDELENLLPEEWRDHIRSFPLTALALGVGVGIYLGMRRSDELISAGSSMVSAAALANVQQVFQRR